MRLALDKSMCIRLLDSKINIEISSYTRWSLHWSQALTSHVTIQSVFPVSHIAIETLPFSYHRQAHHGRRRSTDNQINLKLNHRLTTKLLRVLTLATRCLCCWHLFTRSQRKQERSTNFATGSERELDGLASER